MVGCAHVWKMDGPWQGRPGPGCEAPLTLVCAGCGEARRIACGTSREEKCGPCARVYRARVARVAGSGLRVGRRGLFVTLTAPGSAQHRDHRGRVCRCTPEGGVDLARWNATLGKRWNDFVKELSRFAGADLVTYDDAGRRRRVHGLSYFAAKEVQRRGALHLHILVRRRDGAPLALRVADVRAIAVRHGFGHAVDVQAVQEGHASYVAKYVSKSASARSFVPWKAEQYRSPGRGRRVIRTPWRDELGRQVSPRTVLDLRTGELVGPAVRTMGIDPTYRTWSASRDWGRSMAETVADQQHYVRTLAALPVWARVDEAGCVQYACESRAVWALAVPSRIAEHVPI